MNMLQYKRQKDPVVILLDILSYPLRVPVPEAFSYTPSPSACIHASRGWERCVLCWKLVTRQVEQGKKARSGGGLLVPMNFVLLCR